MEPLTGQFISWKVGLWSALKLLVLAATFREPTVVIYVLSRSRVGIKQVALFSAREARGRGVVVPE